MKNLLILLALFFVIVSFTSTALAYNAYAQENCPAGQFCNPLGSADTIGEVIAKIVSSLYIFAIPISSIFILWGAFQLLTSQGEMEKVRKGKRTITYAIVGLLLMVFASGIGYIITDFLTPDDISNVRGRLLLNSGDACRPNSGERDDCSNCPSGYRALDANRTRYSCY